MGIGVEQDTHGGHCKIAVVGIDWIGSSGHTWDRGSMASMGIIDGWDIGTSQVRRSVGWLWLCYTKLVIVISILDRKVTTEQYNNTEDDRLLTSSDEGFGVFRR